jgi:hypothetical protein
MAEKLIEVASEEAKRLTEESKQNEAEKQLAQQTKTADKQ